MQYLFHSIRNLLLLVLGIFLVGNTYAKSFLSNGSQKKSASNIIIQLDSFSQNNKISSVQKYHPTVIFDVLDYFKKKKYDQAFQLLQTIQVPKKVQKDNIYALYLYLLTYFYFLQNDFENTLNKSNEYLTHFPQYKEVYQMLYYLCFLQAKN